MGGGGGGGGEIEFNINYKSNLNKKLSFRQAVLYTFVQDCRPLARARRRHAKELRHSRYGTYITHLTERNRQSKCLSPLRLASTLPADTCMTQCWLLTNATMNNSPLQKIYSLAVNNFYPII